MKKLFFPILIFFLLSLLALPVLAAIPPPPDTPVPAEADRTTPQLIEAAFRRGEIDRLSADLLLATSLFDAANLPAEFRGNRPTDGTPVLLKLRHYRDIPTIQATAKIQKIQALLSATCSSSTASLPSVISSTHFYAEYGAIGGGLTVNDYLSDLENTWDTEVTQFGWAAPPVPVYPANPAPGGKYPVRIDPALYSGYYGYVAAYGTYAGFAGDNPATPWNDSDAYASCMVLSADYSKFPGTPTTAMQATLAHEFNHSIQYGYGALTGANDPDSVFVEGGATWMEDEVFDNSNDNYNYLYPQFEMCMGEYTASPYPYWVVFRAMTEPFGTGVPGAGEQVMQDFWELTSQNAASNLSALDAALGNKGTSLAAAYHNAAIALAFNKPCGGGYIYPYCLEEGADYVAAKGMPPVQGTISAVGDVFSGSIANNFSMNWVRLPITDTVYQVSLKNTGGGQLRASIACDTGTGLEVYPLASVANAGETTFLPGFRSNTCTHAVAIITNQQQTAANPYTCTATNYTLRASVSVAPILATLPAQSLREDTTLPQAIDLWQYAGDDLDTPAAMTYTIKNTPIISAGVSITGNRYIAIEPVFGDFLNPGWYGTTHVEIEVQDTDGLTATGAFTITVTHIYKILLSPIFKNFTFP